MTGLALCSLLCSSLAAKSKPNIIHVLVDDLGFTDLGYKNNVYQTPYIDSLAKGGVRLNNYYTFTVCAPTRASIMTGRYPWGIGYYWVGGDSEAVNSSYSMLPKLLKEEGGYETVAIGKWHCGAILKQHTPTYRGFDTFFGYYHAATESYWYHGGEGGGCQATDFSNNTGTKISGAIGMNGTYATHAFTDYAIQRIQRHDVANPLYMYLAHFAVHDASGGAGGIEAPMETVDRYPRVSADAYKVQGAALTELDWGVANVTHALQAKGMWENTVLVLTSDNGGPLGHALNAPLRGGKHSYWEGGIRVEAFVYSELLPTEVQGTLWNGLAHSSDWYVTMVEGIAGLTIPGNTGPRAPDGFNLWPSLRSGGDSPRKEVITQVKNEYSKGHGQEAGVIRSGEWKLIVGAPAGGKTNNDVIPFPELSPSAVKFGSTTGHLEPGTNHARATATTITPSGKFDGLCVSSPCLFNLTADPSETTDLGSDSKYADVVKELSAKLEAAAATGPPFAETFLDKKKSQAAKVQQCNIATAYGFVEPADCEECPGWSPSPGPGPGPSPGPSPAPSKECTDALKSSCPIKSFSTFNDCLKCTRDASPVTQACKPSQRQSYCHQIGM